MHCSYAPEFDANGMVVGFLGAITDISERKKAEEKLIATTAKFESRRHPTRESARRN